MSVTIDGFLIDAVISEDHSFDSEVTDHPVETGSDITDNIQAKPIQVTLDCVVSDTPIGPLAATRANRVPLVLDSAGRRLSGGDLLYKPSADAYAVMLAIRDARKTVTISDSLAVFENMALVSMSVPRNAQNGEALRFKATFKQIRFIASDHSTVRVAVPRAAAQQNLGAKAATEVKHPTVHEYNCEHQSAAHRLAGCNKHTTLEDLLGAVPRLGRGGG